MRGCVQQRDRERQLLPPAERKRCARASSPRARGQGARACASVRSRISARREAVDAAVETDVLGDRQVLVEREALAHVADAALDGLALRCRRRGPRRVAAPPVGASSPVSMRIAVVLPAPLAPRKPKTSPARTSNVMRSTAVNEPKRPRRGPSPESTSVAHAACPSAADEDVFDGRRQQRRPRRLPGPWPRETSCTSCTDRSAGAFVRASV